MNMKLTSAEARAALRRQIAIPTRKSNAAVISPNSLSRFQ